jgi:uncharacterized protein
MSSLRKASSSRWLILFAIFALPGALPAQMTPGKDLDPNQLAVAKRLVHATDAEGMILKGMELALPAQRAQNPAINPEFWDRFTAKARADVRLLTDSLAPIYARRFSKTELEQLVAFYESPVGHHLVTEQGAIAQETQTLGGRWGTRLGAATAVEMSDEGKPIKQ